MNKTIEELARKFVDMKTTKQAAIERDKKALLMTQFFQYALKELPLNSRLTEEEKERVKTIYDNSSRRTFGYISTCGFRMEMEKIFGKELFEEE